MMGQKDRMLVHGDGQEKKDNGVILKSFYISFFYEFRKN